MRLIDGDILLGFYNMSHVMRKPVYSICEQQRRRSACASAQSDQRLCFRFLDSTVQLISISEISSRHLVSVAAQAGLCLTWSETPKTGFLVTRLICDCRAMMHTVFFLYC